MDEWRESHREPERHFGLSLVQVLTPFLILAAVIAIGVILVTLKP
jgi:hypothetical protein